LPEAPAIRRAVASKAASIFSLTISLASRRARLPPRISFIIRSATTPFASTANIIKEWNIRRPLQTCRNKVKGQKLFRNGSGGKALVCFLRSKQIVGVNPKSRHSPAFKPRKDPPA
jgi:hypothetical protein